MKIIGIGHYRRVGKDTFANMLIGKLAEIAPHLRVGKRSWAWKLKQITHELYAWAGLREPEFYESEPGASLREVVLPAIGKSPRQIWIDFGTPAVREQVYDRTWLDYLVKNDQFLDVMLVPDTRFLNEAQAVLESGGELIKIVRPGYGPGPNKPDRELLGFDCFSNVIGETGDLEELAWWAGKYAEWLAGGEAVIRDPDEMKTALAVEVVTPWNPDPQMVEGFKLFVDRALAIELLASENMNQIVAQEEGDSGDLQLLLPLIKQHFPDVASDYPWLYRSAA